MTAVRRVDAYLLAFPKWAQLGLIVVTMAVMVWQSLPHLGQPFGTDTIADMYEAKVILNDPLDMYTKEKLDQTPLEAETWSKAESAPYPPMVLLSEAALYAIGQRTGAGFYGMILMLAIVFVGASACYFLQTRWYVFPLLYLNFSYFSYRFVVVQDGSYLVMLVVVMAALLLARAGRPACHALMAVAITMKLSPLYYVTNLPRMSRRAAMLFVAILVTGLVAPYFVFDNYLSIFVFQDEIKGGRGGLLAGLGYGALFSVTLWYIQTRLAFDWEERIGWGLVPFGMFLAMKMNVPRHLLILLLVPDKRGFRNLVAAFALAVPALLPGTVRFGATLPIATVLLFGVLAWHLHRIGWQTVRDDLRHPGRALRMMLGSVTHSG